MPYDLYPAVDENYRFPPEVRQAIATSPETRNQVVPMTTVERNNLAGNELWDGRLILNLDTLLLDRYDAVSGWGGLSPGSHSSLADLEANDHPQYLLRTNGVLDGYGETVLNNGTAADLTVDFSMGPSVYRANPTGPLTVTWSGIPAAATDVAVSATLILDASVTSVTWPVGTKFSGGAAPEKSGQTWVSAVALNGIVTVGLAWKGVA